MSYVFSKAVKQNPEERERRRTLPPKWTTPNVPHHKVPPPVKSKPKLNPDGTKKEEIVKSHEAPVKSSTLDVEKTPFRKTSLPASTFSQNYGTGPKMGGSFARLQAKLAEEPKSRSGLYTEAYEAYRIKRSLKEHGVLPADLRSKDQLRKYSLDKEAPHIVLPRSRESSTSSEKREGFASNRSQTTPTSPTGDFFANHNESVFEEDSESVSDDPQVLKSAEEHDTKLQNTAVGDFAEQEKIEPSSLVSTSPEPVTGINAENAVDTQQDAKPTERDSQPSAQPIIDEAKKVPEDDISMVSATNAVNEIVQKQDEGRLKLNEVIQELESETFEDNDEANAPEKNDASNEESSNDEPVSIENASSRGELKEDFLPSATSEASRLTLTSETTLVEQPTSTDSSQQLDHAEPIEIQVSYTLEQVEEGREPCHDENLKTFETKTKAIQENSEIMKDSESESEIVSATEIHGSNNTEFVADTTMIKLDETQEQKPVDVTVENKTGDDILVNDEETKENTAAVAAENLSNSDNISNALTVTTNQETKAMAEGLEQNGIESEQNGTESEQNGTELEQNGIESEQNGTELEQNGTESEQIGPHVVLTDSSLHTDLGNMEDNNNMVVEVVKNQIIETDGVDKKVEKVEFDVCATSNIITPAL